MSALLRDEWPPAPDAADGSVPIQHLGDGSEVVREVLRSGRPKVVTEDGVDVAVIVDAQVYESLRLERAARELERHLERAIAAADAGDLVDHAAVVQEIRDRYAGKVPPSALRELDGA
jgi:PHD/YefM family antitoxin component YafN of YafNO toxin-antitoxin module